MLNSLIIILIYASLILLSFIGITNPLKANRKANLWFGLFLLLWSTFWMDELLEIINLKFLSSTFFLIDFIQFLTPIAFYLSVINFISPNFKFQIKDFKFLILPFAFITFLILQYNATYDNVNKYKFVLTGLMVFQALIYTIISYRKIRIHQKKILLFSSDTTEINLSWLEYIIILILLICIIITSYTLFVNPLEQNIYINIIFLLAIYAIAYYSLKQKEIFPLNKKQRSEITFINEEDVNDIKKKIVSDEDLVQIKAKLHLLMLEQKPYLDSDLNLIKLAELINTTPHQLSYVINSGFNENFFLFVNKYRIEKAKKLLLEYDFNNLSILGIAFESGFNSKTTFNSTFKKITNQTPSDFKKRSTTL